MKAKILIIVFFLFSVSYISAKETTDEVTLVVSADGTTKEEATKSALRNAIEQAFGTFVSANTEILNDELVKDEIVTISNGNIKNFTEVNSAKLPNGNYTVTLSATVSVSKLVNYVKSKGGSIELAGATFAANVKMAKLNKVNEEKAIDNLIKQIKELSVDAYDYSVELSEPKMISQDKAEIEGKVIIMPNSVSKQIYDIFITTLISLSLSESDIEAYKKMNMPVFKLHIGDREKELNSNEGSYKATQISDIKNIDKRWEIAKVKIGNSPNAGGDLVSFALKKVRKGNDGQYALAFALRSQNSMKKLNELITNDMFKCIMSFAIIDNIPVESIPLDEHQCGYIRGYNLQFAPSFNTRHLDKYSLISLPDLTSNSPYIVKIILRIPVDKLEKITNFNVKKIDSNNIIVKRRDSRFSDMEEILL